VYSAPGSGLLRRVTVPKPAQNCASSVVTPGDSIVVSILCSVLLPAQQFGSFCCVLLYEYVGCDLLPPETRDQQLQVWRRRHVGGCSNFVPTVLPRLSFVIFAGNRTLLEQIKSGFGPLISSVTSPVRSRPTLTTNKIVCNPIIQRSSEEYNGVGIWRRGSGRRSRVAGGAA